MSILDTLTGLKNDVEESAKKVGINIDWNPMHSDTLANIMGTNKTPTQQTTPATPATVEPGTLADTQAAQNPNYTPFIIGGVLLLVVGIGAAIVISRPRALKRA